MIAILCSGTACRAATSRISWAQAISRFLRITKDEKISRQGAKTVKNKYGIAALCGSD
jgi:hypothetical protein